MRPLRHGPTNGSFFHSIRNLAEFGRDRHFIASRSLLFPLCDLLPCRACLSACLAPSCRFYCPYCSPLHTVTPKRQIPQKKKKKSRIKGSRDFDTAHKTSCTPLSLQRPCLCPRPLDASLARSHAPSSIFIQGQRERQETSSCANTQKLYVWTLMACRP